MAGAKGSDARSASSWGVGGGGASGWVTSPFGFCAGPSSVSIGGGSSTTGPGCTESMVCISVVCRARCVRAADRLQSRSVAQQSKMTIDLIGELSLQTTFHSQLGDQLPATFFQAVPGDPLDGGRLDDQHEVIAFFQIATENASMLKVDGESLQGSSRDPLAKPLQFGKVDALIGTDGPQMVGADVEDALGPEIDRLSRAIEKDDADRSRSAVQEFAEDLLKRHAMPRLGPVPRSECRRA